MVGFAKHLSANIASKWSVAFVGSIMYFEVTLFTKSLPAYVTGVRLHTFVSQFMFSNGYNFL